VRLGSEALTVSCDWGVLPVHAPAGVRRHLRELDRLFEIVWATAWFDRAHFLLESLGLDLGPWPVLDWRDLKLPEIVRHASGRPFVWMDDDVGFEMRQLPEGFVGPDQRHLLLEIDPTLGLTAANVETLRAFAAEKGSGHGTQGRE